MESDDHGIHCILTDVHLNLQYLTWTTVKDSYYDTDYQLHLHYLNPSLMGTAIVVMT